MLCSSFNWDSSKWWQQTTDSPPTFDLSGEQLFVQHRLCSFRLLWTECSSRSVVQWLQVTLTVSERKLQPALPRVKQMVPNWCWLNSNKLEEEGRGNQSGCYKYSILISWASCMTHISPKCCNSVAGYYPGPAAFKPPRNAWEAWPVLVTHRSVCTASLSPANW